ncbi:lipopolysaccharide assembly protein LapB [Undibacterium squillarum]|uniref:lipopolysaccharide assembly protein LapB n=1 Tax=Undibacterium squillarum TaxID=1131567 RepID=UPI0035B02D8E
MDFEVWWLLGIPLFFSLGWIAARVDIRQLISDTRTLPRGYFKGLNFLLNDQDDKAIDAFIEIVQLDPEAIELHFALGNLFRRRGETERAIRVHQSLLARPDLPDDQKVQAQYELGQDFFKAGLLDRAEEAFQQLIGGIYEPQARKSLLEIYQREKEWARAIEAAGSLQESGAGSRQKEIAQFYCELAQDELVQNRFDHALEMLEKAIATDRSNVRASILTGDVFLKQGHPEKAINAWVKVEQQSVPHVALVAQRLMDAYRQLGKLKEGLDLLKSFLEQAPSVDLLEVAYKAALELGLTQEANQMVKDELKRTPTLLGLDKLLDVRMMEAPAELRPELGVVKNLVSGYAHKFARYQCAHCGFKARQYYWHCPGCNGWDTYSPRRTEELSVMN